MRVTGGDGRAAELPLYANGGVGANGSAILEAEHSSPGCQSAGSRRLPGSGAARRFFRGMARITGGFSPGLPVRAFMRVLLSAADLAAGIDRLAAEVRREAGETPLVVVGVLTGSIVIVADLIRRLDGPVRVSMAWASSYRGTATEPGTLRLHLDLLPDLTGQDVLVVDDIFDTGRTMEAIVAALKERGAASVRSLVLLRKQGRAEVAIEPDFVGFEIPDVFVVGYGLDFDGTLRQLDHVAALDEADIAAVRASKPPLGVP